MKRHPAALSLLLLLSPLAGAQTLTFGEPFALTNVQYGAPLTQPVVETNGHDFFVFWKVLESLRVTKLVEGEQRGGRHVFTTAASIDPSVRWTGTHFLVVSRGRPGMIAQLLDAEAQPAGAPFVLEAEDWTDWVRAVSVSSNGRTALLLYQKSASGLHAMALTAAGVPTGISSKLGAADSFDLASDGTGFAAVLRSGPRVEAVTFDGDGREQSRTILHTAAGEDQPNDVAIAGNGREYLAVWQLSGPQGVLATHLQADGSTGMAFAVTPARNDYYISPGEVRWTGTAWAVAYTRWVYGGYKALRVAYVHATEPLVVGEDETTAGHFPSMATLNERTVMAWKLDAGGGPVASPLPLAGREPESFLLAPPEQELMAVAQAADSSMLAVWTEIGVARTLRAGIRSPDGSWLDGQIGSGHVEYALAASDGRGFAVVTYGNGEAFAFLVDRSARLTAGPVRLPFLPRSIAWTGTEYLLADRRSTARLTRSGDVSAPIPQGRFIIDAVGSNGTDVVALVREPSPCPVFCLKDAGPRFARIGPDLRVEGEPRPIAGSDATPAYDGRVVWDGTRFVAVWRTNLELHVAALPPGRGKPLMLATFEGLLATRVDAVAIPEGVAVTWRELGPAGHVHSRVAAIGRDGTIRTTAFDDGGSDYLTRYPSLAVLPGGRLAHVVAMAQHAPPDHGSYRVMMRVAGAALPQKPEPPRLTAEVRDGDMHLAWTVPRQEVSGYRVEYRAGDDVWKELGRWFVRGEEEVTISWPLRRSSRHQFRIRAFNDAGASKYSAPVLVTFPKRRPEK